MKIPYSCPYCNHRSTRRWNLEVHIKRRHGGFLVDKSDRYMGSNPPLYAKSVQFGNATVADSIGGTFEPTYLRQQLGKSQYSPSAIYLPTMDHQSFGTGLSEQTRLEELKRLVYKYTIPYY
jgi:hypothetical protein